MKNTIKKLALATVALTGLAPVVGLAQGGGIADPFQIAEPVLPAQNLTYGGIIGLMERAASILFGVLVATSVILLIWAAFNYLRSSKLDDAKTQIISAAVAIAIALLARGLPLLIQSLIGTV